MAQANTITVNDRTTPTPVAHSFAPRGGSAGLAQFTETNSVPIGENNLTIRWRKSNGKYYVRMMLTVPTLVTETINGVGIPRVTRVALIDTTFRFDETSSEAERNDVVGMYANMLLPGQATVHSAIVKLEGIW